MSADGRRRLSMARRLWADLGTYLGPRGRRHAVLRQPFISGAIALAETVTLLSIVQALLLLVDGADTATVSVGPFERRLYFPWLMGLGAGALVVAAALRSLDAFLAGRTAARAVETARRLAIHAFFEADWSHVRQERLGRLQQLLGANALHAATPVQLLSVGSLAACSLLAYTVIVLVLAPAVVGTLLLVALAVTALFTPMRRRTRRAAKRNHRMANELQLTTTSYVQLLRELHVFGSRADAIRSLDEMNRASASAFRRLRTRLRLVPAIYQQTLLASVLALVGAARALAVSPSSFGSAAILAVRSLSFVQQLNNVTQAYAEAEPFLAELEEARRSHAAARRASGTATLDRVETIELRDVSFEYEPGRRALAGVHLDVRAGEWVGIVGPSGGGKTTLANLVVGLLQPTGGEYLVNGRPLTAYSDTSRARAFGLLSQEPVLLRATIARNIAFHRDVAPEAVRAAADLAAIRAEIEQLPDGFETFVGDGFANLSGGQRQRIALARALVDSPSCLVLDEPTSALDAANERAIETALRSLAPDTIVLVISHRPALLERCRRFVVIEQGRIVFDGPGDLDTVLGYVDDTGSGS